MRIGFFTDAYLPTGFGVEVSIESFRKSLRKMGHSVYIFAPEFPGYKDKISGVFRFPSFKIIKKPEMRLGFPSLLEPKKINKLLNFKLDIVHCHTPFSVGFLGKFVASHQKIPIIYTHHTHYPEYAKYYMKEKIIMPRLAKSLITTFSNFSDGVIAPSLKIEKLLKGYRVKKPIFVLPTGVNPKIFKKSAKTKKEFRKRLGIDEDAKILLYVGRMGKEKNIDFLLKAFKEISAKNKMPIILLMLGEGPYLEAFQKETNRLKISQFVNFAGRVPHKDIAKYYQISDVFVFSSLTDTQGIVILEAIASGLPVVALKDDAFKEFVIPNKNGFLIKRGSIKLFAKQIMKIFKNSLLWRKFSENSLKVAKNFSEENQAKKLAAIYQKLIKQKNSFY